MFWHWWVNTGWYLKDGENGLLGLILTYLFSKWHFICLFCLFLFCSVQTAGWLFDILLRYTNQPVWAVLCQSPVHLCILNFTPKLPAGGAIQVHIHINILFSAIFETSLLRRWMSKKKLTCSRKDCSGCAKERTEAHFTSAKTTLFTSMSGPNEHHVGITVVLWEPICTKKSNGLLWRKGILSFYFPRKKDWEKDRKKDNWSIFRLTAPVLLRYFIHTVSYFVFTYLKILLGFMFLLRKGIFCMYCRQSGVFHVHLLYT